jgi:DNA-binding NarL/FixJ family response regulator
MLISKPGFGAVSHLCLGYQRNDGAFPAIPRHATAQIPQLTRPTPRRAAKQAFDGLTAREREVAMLIVQGRSNREIGEEMVVSERTVEKHVENILARLSFSPRAQIAAWAVEKALIARAQDA